MYDADINNLEVHPIGVTVTIPDDDVARLMYYLSCVGTVIEHDNENDMLTDYENYDLLDVNQLTLLFSLVTLFEPSILIKGGAFILDPSLVPEGMGNEFYQITDERINFHFNDEIMIGGKTRRILKVMACNIFWLKRFYYNPMKNIMSLAEKPLPPPPPPKTNYLKPTYYPMPTNGKKPKNEDCCPCLIY